MNRKSFDRQQIQDWVDKTSNTTSTPSRNHLLERLLRDMELFLTVNELKIVEESVRTAATNNFITNLVTALEIYFRDIIIENAGRWSQPGIEELLRDKITLSEALSLAKIPDLQAEHLITLTSAFQNAHAIQRILSQLIGVKDFFKELDDFTMNYSDVVTDGADIPISLRSTFGEWRKTLYELYEIRNRIVHEDNVSFLTSDDVSSYEQMALFVSMFIEQYLRVKLPSKS